MIHIRYEVTKDFDYVFLYFRMCVVDISYRVYFFTGPAQKSMEPAPLNREDSSIPCKKVKVKVKVCQFLIFSAKLQQKVKV